MQCSELSRLFSQQFISYFCILIAVNVAEFGLSGCCFPYDVPSFVAAIPAFIDIFSMSGHVLDLLDVVFQILVLTVNLMAYRIAGIFRKEIAAANKKVLWHNAFSAY